AVPAGHHFHCHIVAKVHFQADFSSAHVLAAAVVLKIIAAHSRIEIKYTRLTYFKMQQIGANLAVKPGEGAFKFFADGKKISDEIVKQVLADQFMPRANRNIAIE